MSHNGVRTVGLLAAAACTLFAGAPQAEQQTAVAAPAPTGDPVFIEFFAGAADGAPVSTLNREDLTLKVSGRVRAVRTLQWIPAIDPGGPDVKAAPVLPPPFGTNLLTTDGRTIVLALDDDSFRPGREQPVREAVASLLGGLSSRDRVALTTMPYGGLKVDFTTEHQRIAVALSRIVGQASADQSGRDLACRTRLTLQALTGFLDGLAGTMGPTTMVFVSSGLAAPRRDAAMALAPGMCELTTDHFAQVGAAASAARAHFYVVLAENVVIPQSPAVENIAGTGFIGSDNPIAGLEHLAGVTGGRQLPLQTARENNLSRIARETGGYYLLTFDPEPAERNGNRHAIDLRVAREGVALRARPAVTIPRRDGRPVRARAPREMLREARAFRDLPLRAIAYASQNAPGDKAIKILTALEAVESSATLTAAAAGLFDPNGKLTAQWTANAEDLATTPVMAALVVPPGTYRLRIAATDATGRGGSADYEVIGDLTPVGPFTVSGLVLGLSRGGSFLPRLQFGKEPVAIGYLEIYGGAPGDRSLAVTIEVAMSPTGPPIVAIPAVIQAASDAGRRMATAAIPVGGLPAGDFVIRALVRAGGQSTVVSRTLRKAL